MDFDGILFFPVTPFDAAGREKPTSFDGPKLAMRVVGVARTGFDLAARSDEPTPVVLTPAFLERYHDTVGLGTASHMVRLVDAPDATGRFTEAVKRAYTGTTQPGLEVRHGRVHTLAPELRGLVVVERDVDRVLVIVRAPCDEVAHPHDFIFFVGIWRASAQAWQNRLPLGRWTRVGGFGHQSVSARWCGPQFSSQ